VRIAARAWVGYVPQIDDVFPPLTVKENLEMGGYLLPGREVSARVDHVVSVFPRLGQMLTGAVPQSPKLHPQRLCHRLAASLTMP
jgi:ABC-type branched-subunit amino acid transport system ATPase component